MKSLIKPVDKDLLLKELSSERFFRKTNNGNNEIYIVSDHDSPNLMLEIGRLRELAFRASGGGTGKEVDIDSFDLGENGFKQLIVWNPDELEIIGGYRFIECKYLPIDREGNVHTPTAKLFTYSEKFIQDYLPFTIELGRSFVQPKYQPAKNMRKGMYALDNLWDGLGSLIYLFPETRYFFGKVTMYPHYDKMARDLILYFLSYYFPDEDKLVYPRNPLSYHHELKALQERFSGNSYKEDYKILMKIVRERKENIPPLVNAYMNLSSTMKYFGTALNETFGAVEETGIIVTIGDIFDFKKDRHLHYDPNEKPSHLK
ncbi:MAG: GNAT family N-acetyltransferase [Bacteroidales bacterium]|jgi:hypothetical protein|nr:GNAT family N-acetyltransferase [Bacteroidales bacterium]